MMTSLAFASDHAGFILKNLLIDSIAMRDYTVVDYGVDAEDTVDYPDLIPPVVEAVRKGSLGVLICSSGIGMSIGANRFPGIRAALCLTPQMAQLTRTHNNANILVLGSRLIGIEDALACLRVFVDTSFEGEERHVGRIEKLEGLCSSICHPRY